MSSVEKNIKALVFVASSKDDLMKLPANVIDTFGHALYVAQMGGNGDAYRAVYTLRFSKAVYVRHCFQKKSKSGIATDLSDIRLIKARLQQAQNLHDEHEREGQ